MCTTLDEVKGALAAWAARFDPALVSTDDAARVVSSAAAIEAIAATLTSLAAARAADGCAWRRDGHRSPAEALARQTGTSTGVARTVLETGRRLPAQDDVVQAALRGELSPAQVTLIAGAVEVDPAAAARLVAQAPDVSLCELRDEVARTRAAALVDPDARRRSIHARRRLRAWTDPEGMWHLAADGNPEDGAQIMAALRPFADARFTAARRAGPRETSEAYAFDALVDCARATFSPDLPAAQATGTTTPGTATAATATASAAPASAAPASAAPASAAPASAAPASAAPASAAPASAAGAPSGRPRRSAPVKLLLRVDYDTWLRGVPTRGETCELVGYGPVSVSAVRDLLAQGDPFVTAVLTKAQAVVGVAHLGRQPTAAQQTALEWLYPSCAVEGCPAHAFLERDHRADWADTHYTMLDLLDRLCSHHHRLKTTANWGLVDGSGKRPFVPPDDPRHPGFRRHTATPATPAPPTATGPPP